MNCYKIMTLFISILAEDDPKGEAWAQKANRSGCQSSNTCGSFRIDVPNKRDFEPWRFSMDLFKAQERTLQQLPIRRAASMIPGAGYGV